MEQIRLEGITKLYEGKEFCVRALDEVNLSINKGEMIAIMGTSGSGKTTLLNILGLIDKPSEGYYFLEGEDVAKLNDKMLAKKRNEKIGFVLQDFGLIGYYTIEQNVMLPLHYSKFPKKEWKQRVKESLVKVGILNKIDFYPSELSGGQKQRVAIARAMITQSDILLADEPTGALDSKTSAEILNLFTQIKKEGKTIIIVTHDIEVAKHCDYIYRIEDGKLHK